MKENYTKTKENKNLTPDYVFESSWEVCNKVGGIYTVLSSKAKTMQNLYDGNVFFIGPDIWDSSNKSPWFVESKALLTSWKKYAKERYGLNVRVGKWNIPGDPKTILVDFKNFSSDKNRIYGEMWEKFGVDSLNAYGDYDEACMFAYATGAVIESFYKFHKLEDKNVVAHFNEWMMGMGLLYVKDKLPRVATVFTTHATTIGRSIAFNGKPLYSNMDVYDGDSMAKELNVESKHSVEKSTAHNADCFTTVSEVTKTEAEKLLKAEALVTPNGFEKDFVPTGKQYDNKRDAARNTLINLTEKLTGSKIDKKALLIATSGRYEYRNKGIDVFVDAIARLKDNERLQKEIIAFILVPAWVQSARVDLLERIKSDKEFDMPLENPYITHNINELEKDHVINQMKYLNLECPDKSKVKLIFIPSYLNGNDGILNIPYYDLLIGLDATIFPSYYEPWGYTPHESIAFSVPTLTTSLAGFGMWAKKIGDFSSFLDGICVIDRDDNNFVEVSMQISEQIYKLSELTDDERKKAAKKAAKKASLADWKHFFKCYIETYCKALHKSNER